MIGGFPEWSIEFIGIRDATTNNLMQLLPSEFLLFRTNRRIFTSFIPGSLDTQQAMRQGFVAGANFRIDFGRSDLPASQRRLRS